jgi:hypothetical protein
MFFWQGIGSTSIGVLGIFPAVAMMQLGSALALALRFHKWRIPNSWMFFFMQNPKMKWMRTGGTPMT